MRRKLWLASFAVAGVAVLIGGGPALVIGSARGTGAALLIAGLMIVAAALAGAAGGRAGRGGRAARRR